MLSKITKRIFALMLAFTIFVSLAACEIEDIENKSEPAKIVLVPEETQLYIGEEKNFTAVVFPLTLQDKSISWSVIDPNNTLSQIDASGKFIAGEKSGTVIVKAALVSDQDVSATAFIKIEEKDADIEEPQKPVEPEDPNILFFDDFNGSELDPKKWTHMTGTKDSLSSNAPENWGNSEVQYYSPSGTRVGGGSLKITAKRERMGAMSWHSSRITTRGNFSFTYGRVEARMRLPVESGFWPAFWMMPDEPLVNGLYQGNWPHSGEIDIMEARGRVPNKTSSALHYNKNGHNFVTKEYTFPAGSSIADFHVYAVEWRSDRIDFIVDGTVYFTITDWKPYPAPFNSNFHIILNLAVGGHFDGHILPSAGINEAFMEIDYVKVTRL